MGEGEFPQIDTDKVIEIVFKRMPGSLEKYRDAEVGLAHIRSLLDNNIRRLRDLEESELLKELTALAILSGETRRSKPHHSAKVLRHEDELIEGSRAIKLSRRSNKHSLQKGLGWVGPNNPLHLTPETRSLYKIPDPEVES